MPESGTNAETAVSERNTNAPAAPVRSRTIDRRQFVKAMCCAAASVGAEAAPDLTVTRIGDGAPHNAFTSLVRYREEWYCAFRQGAAHTSGDGKVQIRRSANGSEWKDFALVQPPHRDFSLYDPKLCVTPQRRLMLTVAAWSGQKTERFEGTWVRFHEGTDWTPWSQISDRDWWFWRPTWHDGSAYVMAYRPHDKAFARLLTSTDGVRFQPLVDRLLERHFPGEASLLFLPNDRCLCVVRRERGQNATLGASKAPYREWTWNDLPVFIGGPAIARLPDERVVVAGRFTQGGKHTAVARLDIDTDKVTLTPLFRLTSGGDCGYPGLVWHENRLWISYYSSHEEKTAVYVATARLAGA